jgi:hypothetical protein
MDSAQGSDIAPIFEELSRSENLSEIKPPLSEVIYLLNNLTWPEYERLKPQKPMTNNGFGDSKKI